MNRLQGSMPIGASRGYIRVDAEYKTPLSTVQLLRFHLTNPIDDLLYTGEGYRLDLSVMPRPANARARFVDRWRPHHYERIGALFLLQKGERVHARSETGEGATIVCHLQPQLLRKWFGEELEWNDERLKASLDITSESLKGLILRMGSEIRTPRFGHEMLLELMAGQLALELRRYCTSVECAPKLGGPLARWRLRIIDERLASNEAIPTLTELAVLCRLSVRQLTRGFRLTRGCSIGTYIANHQVEEAKRLLVSGECIKVIAQRLGFASASSFTFAFRKATGSTPRGFRERTFRVI